LHYYKINLMPRHNPDFCFLQDFPQGVGLNRYKFGKGEAFGDEYPEGARVYMSSKERGMKLPSLIGNIRSMLIVHQGVKETIEKMNKGPTEYLPLQIFNHKKRLASDEYFIINPLGGWDCLDLSASKIDYLDGKVADVLEIVLDKEKLKRVPELFRIREDTTVYVASHTLMQAVVKGDPKPTNLYIDKLPVAGE
jgi:hypothetical protein